MKRCTAVIVFALFFVGSLLAAITPAQISLDSPIYREMDTLYRLTGRPLPSSSRPWNSYEALQLLEAVPAGGRYAELWNAIADRLDHQEIKRVTDTFAWRITPTLNAEVYLHTNPGDFTTYSDWMYSYDERKPMLSLDIAMQYGNTFYFATALEVGVGAYSETLDPTPSTTLKFDKPIGALFDADSVILPPSVYLYREIFNTNIYRSGMNFEADFPRCSQLTVAGPWWEVSLGRGPRKWGHGATGDLIIGSHISNHTSLSASFFSPTAKIQLLYLFFTDFVTQTRNRMFLGHRFEFQPLSWARFTFSENIMVLLSGISPEFFDPTYMYHNVYDPHHANAIAALEAEFVITRGLSFHAQAALDQFQLPSEGGSEANAMAFLANLSYSWQQRRGYWTAQAEFVLIDPAFYRREEVDFLVARGLLKNQISPVVIIDYLGYRWGSDSLVYSANIGYYIPDLLDLTGSVTIHRQGEMTYRHPHDGDDGNNTTHPTGELDGPPPYGNDVTERLIISLAGSWQTPVKGLSLHSQIDWIGRRVYHKDTKSASDYVQDLQITVGVSKSF